MSELDAILSDILNGRTASALQRAMAWVDDLRGQLAATTARAEAAEAAALEQAQKHAEAVTLCTEALQQRDEWRRRAEAAEAQLAAAIDRIEDQQAALCVIPWDHILRVADGTATIADRRLVVDWCINRGA